DRVELRAYTVKLRRCKSTGRVRRVGGNNKMIADAANDSALKLSCSAAYLIRIVRHAVTNGGRWWRHRVANPGRARGKSSLDALVGIGEQRIHPGHIPPEETR